MSFDDRGALESQPEPMDIGSLLSWIKGKGKGDYKGKGKEGKGKVYPGKGKSPTSYAGQNLCRMCGRPGHFARECWLNKGKGKTGGKGKSKEGKGKDGKPRKCFNCGREGHQAKDCWQHRSQQRQWPSKWNAAGMPKGMPKGKFGVCRKCGKYGHQAKEEQWRSSQMASQVGLVLSEGPWINPETGEFLDEKQVQKGVERERQCFDKSKVEEEVTYEYYEELVRQGKKVVIVKAGWVLKQKTADIVRARLVAQQVSDGSDQMESYCPTPKQMSHRLVMARARRRKWTCLKEDVTTAFLQALRKSDEIVLAIPPESETSGRKVLRLSIERCTDLEHRQSTLTISSRRPSAVLLPEVSWCTTVCS